MHVRYFAAAALALLAATSSAQAQTRPRDRMDQPGQRPVQFDNQARQTTQDWYNQHQSKPPAGLRSRDRLTPDQESRLQPGRALDPDLRQRLHPVPRDLARRLPPPPPQHRYVAVGGHVGIVDSVNNILRDVIHLHDQ
jgi:Ni/Co efflux regulator RcnB